MARVVETDDPVVVNERDTVPQHSHDAAPRRGNSVGAIIAIIILILIIIALFWWRPWGGSSTGDNGGTNINVTTPSGSGGSTGQ